jgi:signal transduction histidine kinase
MKEFVDQDTLIRFLNNISLFKQASQSVLSHLAEKTIFTSFKAGETIIHKNEMGDTMYLIFSGLLKVHDGDHQVATLKKGDFFGELSLLDSEPRSMSVSALEDSVLGSITRAHFYEVLHEFPEITSHIIAVLNKRLRNHNEVLIGEFKTREAQLTELVKIRTRELEIKNVELEQAMDELKKSQQQLIQSEKMASLGQLTAGIAHEIKNPLNFVNNFSQLSSDLLEELKEVKTEEDREEILSFLKTNIEKINQHGRQADSIVKGMLEHTRTGTGEKQPTNINQLCQEYFQLAYSGMQGNNPGFTCELVKNLAPELPEVNIVSKDIARVLLNIFNNAFYSVQQKGKNEKSYRPAVTLATEAVNGHISIKIHDNGTGIPGKIIDKIFQPFFTTKPTGQGTGLGLSLSYDIIHSNNGRILVESTEGQGAEFEVTLPV